MSATLTVGAAVAGVAVAALWLATRGAVRARLQRAARRAVRQYQARIAPHKLVSRRVIRDELLQDPEVRTAIEAHARAHDLDQDATRQLVVGYLNEILPFFNVLSYYKLAYNLARGLLHVLYEVTVLEGSATRVRDLPKNDVVVYLPNHRSNIDYVLLLYVLAHGVSISYAVGEWARTWPLEHIFKSFGSYFVRRGFPEPLYHTVLRRYVQLITRHGVTQGVFLEGGLTQDGRLRAAKTGLLDSILNTLADRSFTGDIWLVPVGLNFDRVLEDRTLIHELVDAAERPGRIAQLRAVAHYLWRQSLRFLFGRLRRYGDAAVHFGTPISARAWLARHHTSLWDRERSERRSLIQELADSILATVATSIPITPVPLAAAALLSFDASAVRQPDLLERIDEMRDALRAQEANVIHPEETAERLWDRAWSMLRMRRLVVSSGDALVILPKHRPLLEYYANSISHLLPPQARAWHKSHDADESLPRLQRKDAATSSGG